MASLWASRKFRIVVYDAGVALVAFVVGTFFDADVQGKIMEVVAILQPPVLFLIGGIALEDAAAKRAGTSK